VQVVVRNGGLSAEWEERRSRAGKGTKGIMEGNILLVKSNLIFFCKMYGATKVTYQLLHVVFFIEKLLC